MFYLNNVDNESEPHLTTASKWLKNNGMKDGWVTPWNPESELATQRAIAFYLSNGGTIREE